MIIAAPKIDISRMANIAMRKTPAWVWAIILFYAALEPALHCWIQAYPPADAVPSGLHIGDDVFFLQPMRMASTECYSPYATCQAPEGPHGFAFFPLPYHYFYALIGLAADVLNATHFMALGLANGLGCALYLYLVYRFLREITPCYANTAFLLFTLTGGPGGILFALTGAFGLHDAPMFDVYFKRYAWYELIEEGNLTPVLQMVRLYKVFPLAMFYLGLTWVHRAMRIERSRIAWAAAVPFCIGAFLNVVYGPVMLCLAIAMTLSHRMRFRLWMGPIAGTALGGIAAGILIGASPVYAANAAEGLRRSMWLSPFLSAMLWHVFTAPQGLRAAMGRLPKWPYIAACGILGYLIAFMTGYLAYQLYYGNFAQCLDFSAAVSISDPALIGLLPGLVWGYLHHRKPYKSHGDVNGATEGWVALWALGAIAIALSAWGRGEFLQYTPKRLMFVIALPVCILSAEGLARIAAHAPRRALAIWSLFLISGAFTIPVAAAWFQGPLGYHAGKGPFAFLHAEYITRAEAQAIDSLSPGIVLCPIAGPPYMADVIAFRPGARVVFGQGTLDFADKPMNQLGEAANRFFQPATTPDERTAILNEWCVDYVYCPDAFPVDPHVIDALRAMPQLEETLYAGHAFVFHHLPSAFSSQ